MADQVELLDVLFYRLPFLFSSAASETRVIIGQLVVQVS